MGGPEARTAGRAVRRARTTVAPDFARYGIAWSHHREYEDDHLVPLCLGGADTPANRRPEPIAAARVKNEFEVEACREVCRGAVPLSMAQGWFLGDWRAAWRIVFGSDP